jgi:hypothetical protein
VNFRIGDEIPTVVGLARQMLVHRVPRYAVATARAQQVSGRNGLRSPAAIKRHAHAVRIIFDRRHFGAKFHC